MIIMLKFIIFRYFSFRCNRISLTIKYYIEKRIRYLIVSDISIYASVYRPP